MNKIKQYLLDNYEHEQIQEINRHGCSGGSASTLVYYHETNAFHDEYEEEIWDLLEEHAKDSDLSIMEYIAKLKDKDQIYSIQQLKNYLCWYAIEWAAYEIAEVD